MSEDESSRLVPELVVQTLRYEAVQPLTSVKGYTELLLLGAYGDLTDQQREAVEKIKEHVQLLLAAWQHFTLYLYLRKGVDEVLWEDIALADAVKKTVSYLQYYRRFIENIEVVLDKGLPRIKSAGNLDIALANFICPLDVVGHLQQDFCPTISASLTDGPAVLVKVRSGLNFAEATGLKIEQLTQVTSGHFSPGSWLEVAALIIERHGSWVETDRLEQGTEFRFTLPVWQDELHTSEQ